MARRCRIVPPQPVVHALAYHAPGVHHVLHAIPHAALPGGGDEVGRELALPVPRVLARALEQAGVIFQGQALQLLERQEVHVKQRAHPVHQHLPGPGGLELVVLVHEEKNVRDGLRCPLDRTRRHASTGEVKVCVDPV